MTDLTPSLARMAAEELRQAQQRQLTANINRQYTAMMREKEASDDQR